MDKIWVHSSKSYYFCGGLIQVIFVLLIFYRLVFWPLQD
jgi:hypothetical protein